MLPHIREIETCFGFSVKRIGCEIMKRNYSIELLKLYLAISVAFLHAEIETKLPFMNGQIAVFLFFVLSGYFLVGSFNSGKYNDASQCTFARIKRIYPYYIAAFLIMFVAKAVDGFAGVGATVETFFTSLPEMFLLQNIGVFSGGINYPLWQMCCLIVISHILFGLLEWNKKTTINVICPLTAIGVFTYLSNAYGTNTVDIWGVEADFLYVPLLRAAGGMSVGVILYHPLKQILARLENSTAKWLPSMVSIATIPLFLIFWLNRNSFSVVIPFAFILVCMFYSKGFYARFFQKKIFSKLDKLSLSIYLCHALVYSVLKHFTDWMTDTTRIWVGLAYIAIVIVYGVALVASVDFVMRISKKIFDKHKSILESDYK